MQVWVDAELDKDGRVQFSADSDSEVTRGLAAVLAAALSGLTPAQVIEVIKSASPPATCMASALSLSPVLCCARLASQITTSYPLYMHCF